MAGKLNELEEDKQDERERIKQYERKHTGKD